MGFSALAFICLWHFKIYPSEINSTILNSDWIYRKMLPGVCLPLLDLVKNLNQKFYKFLEYLFVTIKNIFANTMIKNKVFDREVGQDTLIVVQLFIVILVLIFMWKIYF